jgi:methyl-accepting chemotaxis protein
MQKNFGIRTRLFVAVSVMSFLMLAIGGVGVWAISDAARAFDDTYVNEVRPIVELGQLSDTYSRVIIETAHRVEDGTLDWAQGRQVIAQARVMTPKLWKEYQSSRLTPAEAELASQINALMPASEIALDKLAAIALRESREEAARFNDGEVFTALAPLGAKLTELVGAQVAETETVVREVEDRAADVRIALIACVLLGVALSAVLGFFLHRFSGEMGELVGDVQRRRFSSTLRSTRSLRPRGSSKRRRPKSQRRRTKSARPRKRSPRPRPRW